VDLAWDGEDAQGLVGEANFDLVILDLVLPEIDVWEENWALLMETSDGPSPLLTRRQISSGNGTGAPRGLHRRAADGGWR
jgi:DNA-binding response OmpR family regulator